MMIGTGLTAINCGGDGFRVKDGASANLRGIRSINNDGDGVHVDGGSFLNLSNSVSQDNGKSGYYVGDSGFNFNNVSGTGNGIGLELGEKAGGYMRNSRFRNNREVDIQYHRNNIVKIFNTEARNVQSTLRSLDGMLKVNSGWVATRILNTTDLAIKARNILKLARWLGIAVVSSEALNLAKDILG
jgi:hypothetical protein